MATTSQNLVLYLPNPDEVVNQRLYGVLPLNYGAEYQVAPVGLEPTTSGF
jgi:hypothetical protein